jgi:hypothetical protein
MSEKISATNQRLYGYSAKVGTDMPSYYAWKGKSFHQIVSAIQMNTTQLDVSGHYQNYQAIGANIFRAQPLQMYRKEIANVPLTVPTQPRTGVSIDEINRPGGTIMVQQYHTTKPTGLDGIVLDAQEAGETNNTTEQPGACTSFTTNGLCLAQETNARRRCRSSGRMKHTYNSSMSQYLAARNRTFQQNQFNYLVTGNRAAEPGTALAAGNQYSTQSSTFGQLVYDASGTLSTCSHVRGRPYTKVIYKPNNPRFAQQGGADAGAYILLKKFDTITNNTVMYRRIYGNSVASAMGYGVADSVYTYKGKMNYPTKCTPVFHPYTQTTSRCTNVNIDYV